MIITNNGKELLWEDMTVAQRFRVRDERGLETPYRYPSDRRSWQPYTLMLTTCTCKVVG